jgi:hypothetical protein
MENRPDDAGNERWESRVYFSTCVYLCRWNSITPDFDISFRNWESFRYLVE